MHALLRGHLSWGYGLAIHASLHDPLSWGSGFTIRFVAWPLELGLGTLNPLFVVWPLSWG